MYLPWLLEASNEPITTFLKDTFKAKVSIPLYHVIVTSTFEYTTCLVMVTTGCAKERLLQSSTVLYAVWEIGEFVFVMHSVED